MTKEQLEIAVKLNRSLEQLEWILDRLEGRCKDEIWYVSARSLAKDELKIYIWKVQRYGYYGCDFLIKVFIFVHHRMMRMKKNPMTKRLLTKI